MLKYFAWKERGFWMGGKLLTRTQILSLLKHLDHKHETFESVQLYGQDAEILSCPIYADFDHRTDLATVQDQVGHFVRSTEYHLNVTPNIYFSGNKGFHVIVPYSIEHPRCHEIARAIVSEIGLPPTLDMNVYRTRSMLRTVGSPASKPGRFKMQITREELFHMSADEIIEKSRTRCVRLVTEYDESKINDEALATMVKIAVDRLPQHRAVGEGQFRQGPMTPCLTRILDEGADDGMRNRAVFLLAKHYRLAGYSLPDAEMTIMSRRHFQEWEATGEVKVTNTIRSVYRQERLPTLGCKSGTDGELLRQYCHQFCIFSDTFPDLNIGDHHGAETRPDPAKTVIGVQGPTP